MNRPLTSRQIDQLESEHRSYRMGKMDRDYQLELLLTAGVPLAEARATVDGAA
jgi:hypothetical protein